MALTKVTGGLLGNLPTGTNNVAVGDTALDSIASGAQYNVAIGSAAGTAVTTGVRNTLMGAFAGDGLTDADFNTAIGYGALDSDTLGSGSTAIGYQALQLQNFTTATNAYNTAVGLNAGKSVTTGSGNVFFGAESGDAMTTGSSNTILGRFGGNEDGVDIRTGSNNIILSDGAGQVGMRLSISGGVAFIEGDGTTRFSAGATLPSSTDFDDIKFPGMYRVDNNATNAPTTNFHALIVFGNASNVTSQIAVKLASTESYVRSFNASWSSWARLDT